MNPYGSKDSQIRIVSWSCERKGHNNETTEINPENKVGKTCGPLKVWKFAYYQLSGEIFPLKDFNGKMLGKTDLKNKKITEHLCIHVYRQIYCHCVLVEKGPKTKKTRC